MAVPPSAVLRANNLDLMIADFVEQEIDKLLQTIVKQLPVRFWLCSTGGEQKTIDGVLHVKTIQSAHVPTAAAMQLLYTRYSNAGWNVEVYKDSILLAVSDFARSAVGSIYLTPKS